MSHPFFSFLVITPSPNFQWSAPAFICLRTFCGLWGTYFDLCSQTRNTWKKLPSWTSINQWVVGGGGQIFQLPSFLSWTVLRSVFCAASQRSPVGLSSSCLTHSVPFAFLPFLTFHPPPGSLGTTSKINYFHLHSVLGVCLWGSPD